jgi:hypothetical protein
MGAQEGHLLREGLRRRDGAHSCPAKIANVITAVAPTLARDDTPSRQGGPAAGFAPASGPLHRQRGGFHP